MVRRMGAAAIVVLGLAIGGQARPDGDAVAIVNGAPIGKERLYRALLDTRGVEMLQQLVLVELARGECKARGLNVTAGDIEAEYQDSLAQIGRDAGLGPEATRSEQDQALGALLEQKRISRSEFLLSMERNAHLRKIVEKEVVISEATLRAEYARTHGEKRIVRHIQIPSNESAGLGEALNQLQAGVDFAEVARRLSRNPETAGRGGEMDPIGFTDELVPAALREAVFALKVGQTSTPVRTEQMIHILKLERIVEPADAGFNDVRQDLERRVKQRAVTVEMSKLAVELYRKAKVNVLDGELKKRYDEFKKRGESAGGGS
jgi:foldase protein PrsA